MCKLWKSFLIIFITFTCVLTVDCYADFTTTDSLNLSNCQTHLNSIDTKLSTLQNSVSTINNNIVGINTNVTTIASDTTTIRNQLHAELLKLDTISSYLATINGDTTNLLTQVNNLYTKAQSIDTQLTTITNQLSTIITELQSGNQNIVDNIQSGNQTAEETKDFITNESVQESSMDVDTSDYDINDTNGTDDFISDVLNELYVFFNGISDSNVYTVEIPLPYGMDSIVLRSDIISSHIRGTVLYTLIQTMWTFVFGTYLLFYVRFIIKFFSSGEFETSGLAFFIAHLEDNDVIIRSTMM